MPTNYKPVLDGFPLHITQIADNFTSVIVAHEYPYRRGADLEDMGTTARACRFTCAFYAETFDLYALAFIEHVQVEKENEFTHPTWGVIRGRVRSQSVAMDDREKTAIIDIEFVEQMRADDSLAPGMDVVSATETAFVDGQVSQMDAFTSEATATLGSASAGVLRKTLDGSATVMSQITGVGKTARDYVRAIDAELAVYAAAMNTITNPAESIIAAVEYGTTLPGRVIGEITRTVERYSIALATTVAAPSRFITDLMGSIDALAATVPLTAKRLRAAAALYGATRLAAIYRDDETVRASARTAVRHTPFDRAGEYQPAPTVAEPLTLDELDRSAAIARAGIQRAIDDDRSVDGLKEAADAIRRHVESVRSDRDRIEAVTIPAPTPLFIVCLNRGISYMAAERAATINPGSPNPNVMEGTVNVYAR